MYACMRTMCMLIALGGQKEGISIQNTLKVE